MVKPTNNTNNRKEIKKKCENEIAAKIKKKWKKKLQNGGWS